MTCTKFQHCYLSMQFKLAPLSSSSFAFRAFLSPSNRYQLGLPTNLRIRVLHPLSQSLSFIHSICSNLFRTLRSTRPLIISLTPTMRLTSSFLILCLLVDPHALHRQCISMSSSLYRPFSLIPQVSASYVPVASTILPNSTVSSQIYHVSLKYALE